MSDDPFVLVLVSQVLHSYRVVLFLLPSLWLVLFPSIPACSYIKLEFLILVCPFLQVQLHTREQRGQWALLVVDQHRIGL